MERSEVWTAIDGQRRAQHRLIMLRVRAGAGWPLPAISRDHAGYRAEHHGATHP